MDAITNTMTICYAEEVCAHCISTHVGKQREFAHKQVSRLVVQFEKCRFQWKRPKTTVFGLTMRWDVSHPNMGMVATCKSRPRVETYTGLVRLFCLVDALLSVLGYRGELMSFGFCAGHRNYFSTASNLAVQIRCGWVVSVGRML